MASRLSRYLWKRRRLRLGSIELEYEALQDLDQAIEVVCSEADIESLHSVDEALDLSPYFGIVWPSALGLIRYLENKIDAGEIKSDARILEIGCGLGIPALWLKKLGMFAEASDFHPDVPARFHENAGLNGIDVPFHVMDWRRLDSGSLSFDFVIGSDILYERYQPDAVAEALKCLLTENGTALIADPGRSYLQETANRFEELGWKTNLEVSELPELPDGVQGPTEIWILEVSKSREAKPEKA